MFKKSKLAIVLTLAVGFCFAIVAVNSNNTFASEELELRILKNVKVVKRDVSDIKSILKKNCRGVPKTGQTVSQGPRDDGELQKGIPWPIPRFTNNGDGTVTDNLTGLVWLKAANCHVANWANALDFCNNLADGQCGLADDSIAGDWRLPNVRELQSLVDYGVFNPSVPTEANATFDAVQSNAYWSSTYCEWDTSKAWYLNLSPGTVTYNPITTPYFVWPVRDLK